MAVLEANLSPRDGGAFSSLPVAVVRWIPFIVLAAALHAAALFISMDALRGTGANDFHCEGALEITVQSTAPELMEEPPSANPGVLRVPVQYVATLGAEEVTFVLSSADVTQQVQPKGAVLPAASVADLDPLGIPNGPVNGARGGPLAEGTDSPLAAGPIGEGFGTGTGRGTGNGAGAGLGGSGIGAPGGRGGGAGGEGRGQLGKGGGNAIDRKIDAMRGPATVPALRLPGKPMYPSACRSGLCRSGTACQGNSEWKVAVSASGGQPTKVDAVRKMECELQNASIRKFFNETKFPATGEDCVYQFPVTMMLQD